ncbi:MAG: hypothetical protein E7178_03170 [Erysipelotrichaceae bacterium]|nr:hypothetical protein [Erysipelotrichaceae bacterium]
MILVSFLGNVSGSFTISLNTGNVKISLSNNQEYLTGKTEDGRDGVVSSFLKVDTLKAFDQMTFRALPSDDVVDNETTPYNIGESSDISMKFFKYTFFIKNMGTISADYNLTVRIVESKPAMLDGRPVYLDSMIRVMLYQNDGYDVNSHNYEVYALASEKTKTDLDGNITNKEYISISPELAEDTGVPFPGFATEFKSENVVTSIPVKYFNQSDMNRYTIVAWIEGYDPQSGGMAPQGATIKLGVEINAYENE